MIGRTIGHYRIVEKLGEGGMGVVYKARDTSLNRNVALKLLLAGALESSECRQRFLQEAKAASALSHPNIVTVFEAGESDSSLYFVMEYVAGETLARIIRRKPVPLAVVLRYAIQIADALAAAHKAGVVHRDIKPGNLMVNGDDHVKVLDFGIAKLSKPVAPDFATTVAEFPRTRTGQIVGTFAYMSPEQAESRPVDGRSDIFSFGAVFYEMLTGKPPFGSATSISAVAGILRDQPEPPARSNPDVPPEIERIVSRCLEKDPNARFQSAADLKLALEWVERDYEAGKLGIAPPPKPARPGRRWMLGAAGAVLAAVAVTTAIAVRFRPAPVRPPEISRITADIGLTTSGVLSRDGKLLVYAADRGGDGNLDIWVQQLPGGEPMRRTHTEADELSPDFSPDASNIVFERSHGGIYVMPALVGDEKLVAPDGFSPRFSPDGTLIAYWSGSLDSERASGKVYVVPLGRGAPKRLAGGFADARFPVWASDGKHVLFQGYPKDRSQEDWWVVPVQGGAPQRTGALPALRAQKLSPIPGPGDWRGSHVVFSAIRERDRHIWYGVLDPRSWKFSFPAEQLTYGTGVEGDPSLTPDGQVAFSSWQYQNNLWRLDLRAGAKKTGIQRFSDFSALETHPSLSADGRMLAFLSRRTGPREVWIRDVQSGEETALTIGSADKMRPVLSPNGAAAAYSMMENGKLSMYVVSASKPNVGATHRVCEDCGTPSGWSPNGRKILQITGKPHSVRLLDANSGTSTPLLEHPQYDLEHAQVSPDGEWVAFVALLGPQNSRIYVAPFREDARISETEWVPVTDGSSWDDKPRWLDSSTIVFFSLRDQFGCIWKQSLQSRTKKPAGAAAPVWHFHTRRRSLLTLYREAFDLAAARDSVFINLVEITGNLWLTHLP